MLKLVSQNVGHIRTWCRCPHHFLLLRPLPALLLRLRNAVFPAFRFLVFTSFEVLMFFFQVVCFSLNMTAYSQVLDSPKLSSLRIPMVDLLSDDEDTFPVNAAVDPGDCEKCLDSHALILSMIWIVSIFY